MGEAVSLTTVSLRHFIGPEFMWRRGVLGRGIFVYVFVYLCAHVYFVAGFRSFGGWDFLALRKLCV